ncbi:MAG: OmpA family protein, partial [Albidovulum sp.]|nr:OmpA family protein [Albidovulum sp.]
GRSQLADIAGIVRDLSDSIPEDVDWIIRVDGHTDNVPFLSAGEFSDNWELSQGRALAVVRYLVDSHGVPEARLAAAGFGEFRPISSNDTPDGRKRNRRIELKLTEP